MAAHQPPAGAAGPAQPPHIVVPPILVGHPVTQQLFPLIQGGIILSPASDQDAIIVVQFTKTLRSWTATTPAEEVASYDLLHVVMSSRVAAQPGNNQPPLLGIANLQNQVAQIQARIGHLQADLTNKFEHIRARLLNMASSALSLPLIIVPMNGVPPPVS
nr:uncharacterized protein CI109_006169 [Kwoniella shandongensis]KAA5525478.1 hypothetical protein CI109_006169 [Kwoniella shandongensis]